MKNIAGIIKKGKPKKVCNFLCRTRIFLHELLYKSHIGIRYLHDTAYQKYKPYKKYSDLPITTKIHKATLAGFLLSFVVFTGLQVVYPYYFSATPRDVTGISLKVEDPKTREVTYEQWQNQRSRMKDVVVSGDTISGKIYASPVQYQTEGGEWADIDTTIERFDGGYRVVEAPYRAYFAANVNDPFRLVYGEHEIQNSFIEAAVTRPIVDTDKITYPNVYPNTNVERIFGSDGVKQNIVLTAPGHPAEFKEKISTSLRMVVQEDNSINYYQDSKLVMSTPPIKLIDADGVVLSPEISLENSVLTVVVPSTRYLSYPISIDPANSIYGASGDDCYTDYSNDGYGEYFYVYPTTTGLSVGSAPSHIFSRFPIAGLSEVSSASVNFYQIGGSSNPGITTYHMPPLNPGTDGYSTLLGYTPYSTIGSFPSTLNTWLTIDVTANVQNDVTNSRSYTHYKMSSSTSSYFYSNDNASNKPYLYVITGNPPAAPTGFSGATQSSSSILWSWTDNSNNELGFYVHDASDNNVSGNLPAGTTQWLQSGLSPNTNYGAYHVHAYTADDISIQSNTDSEITLSAAPDVSETSARAINTLYNVSSLTFQNDIAFGAGGVQYYRYSFDQSATHSWTEAETQWSVSTITNSTIGEGSYYLHLKSYNSANVAGSTLDYGPFIIDHYSPTITELELKDNATGSNQYSSGKVKISGIINDLGGISEHIIKIQFSANGTDWGVWNGSANFTTGGTNWAEGTYLEVTPSAVSQTIDNSGAGVWNFIGSGAVGLFTRTSDGINLSGGSYNTRGDFNSATLSSITVGGTTDADITSAKLTSSPGTGANMILLWDGATAPTGWEIISDQAGEPFYQRFIRGAATYGGTGGSLTHSHTHQTGSIGDGDTAIGPTSAALPSAMIYHGHSTVTVSYNEASSLPSYRNLKVIKYLNGIPANLPQGAIAFFESSVPSEWSRYTSQDGYFIRGDGTITTGGSNSHTHPISVTTGVPTSTSSSYAAGVGQYVATTATHTHSKSDTAPSASNMPLHTVLILAKLNVNTAPPTGIISMFDAVPQGWTSESGIGGTYNQHYIVGGDSYVATAGSSSHSHSGSLTLPSAGVVSGTGINSSGGSLASAYHRHPYSYTSNPSPNAPPYIDVVIAKKNISFASSGTIGGSDTGLRFGDPGGLTNKWGNLLWEAQNLGTDVDANKIKLQVRAGDTWGTGDTGYVNPADGTASYYEINSGSLGPITLHSSIAEAKTFEIRAVLEGDGATETTLAALHLQASPYDVVDIDLDPPNPFDILSPANGSQQGGSPTFTWQATTDVGLAGLGKYQLYINDELNRDNIPPETTSTTPTAPLGDGNYSWYIKAVDNYGNARQSTSTWNIVVDATGPIITDNQSGDDTWRHNTGTYNVDFSDPGFGLLQFETKVTTAAAYGGTVIQDWTKVADLTGATYTTDWVLLTGTWDLMQQGTNYVYVRATDAINNLSTSEDYVFYVKKDTILPASVVTTSGYYGSTENPWPGSISGTAADTSGSGVQKTEIKIATSDNRYWNGSAWTDQLSWVQATGTTAWSYTISQTNFADGIVYTVESKTTDVAGNVQESLGTNTFNYDSTFPEGTININNGAVYSGASVVELRFPDTSADVDKMKLSNIADLSADGDNVGSGTWVNFNSGPVSWNLSSGNGTKTVYVKLKDLAGNESEQIYSDSIILDTNTPSSTIISPADSVEINSLTSINGTVTEVGSGFTNKNQVTVALINESGYYWNGVMFDLPEVWLEVTTLTGELPNYTWTYTALPNFVNGDYLIKVKATDDAGNAEIPGAGHTFVFDNTPPVISSLSSSSHPNQSLWIGANDVSLAWSATDVDTGNTEIAGYSYSFDESAETIPDNVSEGLGTTEGYNDLEDGLRYFHLKALDGAGNWSSVSHYTIRIDSTAPQEGTPVFAVNGIDDSNIEITFGRFVDLAGPDEYKIYRATVSDTPTSTSSTDPNIDPASFTYPNLVTTIVDDESASYSHTDSGLSQGWYYYAIYVTDKSSPVNTSAVLYSHSKTNYIPNDINLTANGSAGPLTVAPADSRTLNLAWTTTDPDGQADIVTTKVTVKNPDGSVLATYTQTDPRMTRTSIANGYSITATYTFAAGAGYGNYSVYATTIDTIGLNAHIKDSNSIVVKITPDAPQEFTATGIKSTEIDLAWEAPVVTTGLRVANRYEVHRKLSSETDDAYTSIGQTSDLTFINTGLLMETEYSYRVRAYDISDNAGLWSTPVTSVPPKPEPTSAAIVKEASAISVDLGGNNPVRYVVTWNIVSESQVPDFKGYKVYREIDGVWETDPLAEIDCDSLGYNQAYYLDLHPAADASKIFRYKVTTWDESDNIGDFTETLATSAPLTPEITVQPQISDRGVSWLEITWSTDQSTKSIVQYKKTTEELYTNLGGDPRATMVQEGENYVNTVTVSGLDKGTSYDFKVQSLSLAGYLSNESNKVTGETKPFNINYDPNTGKTLTTSAATITWDTGEVTCQGYIEYKQGNSGETKVVGTGRDATEHEVVINSLVPADYVFTLKNIDADGNIATSGLQSFTITGFETGTISAPQAGKIEEQDITATSAKITWTSSVPTSSWIDYGTATDSYTKSTGNDTLTVDHVLNMDGLTPGTTYYYIVRGVDANGIEYKSKEYSFIALAKPGISSVEAIDISSYGAKIKLEATKEVRATVSYGKSGTYNLKAGTNTYSRTHEIVLENLEDASDYSYIVDVVDSVGNTAKSDVNSFATPMDRVGPKVEELKIDILPLGDGDEFAQAIISWKTDKPSTTQVQYDVGLVGGDYSKSSIEDTSLSTAHTVIIKELEVASTYHYRIVAKDKRNNQTTSNDYTFVTPEKNKSIWQLIVRSLEETFSWVKNVGGFFNNLGKKAQ